MDASDEVGGQAAWQPRKSMVTPERKRPQGCSGATSPPSHAATAASRAPSSPAAADSTIVFASPPERAHALRSRLDSDMDSVLGGGFDTASRPSYEQLSPGVRVCTSHAPTSAETLVTACTTRPLPSPSSMQLLRMQDHVEALTHGMTSWSLHGLARLRASALGDHSPQLVKSLQHRWSRRLGRDVHLSPPRPTASAALPGVAPSPHLRSARKQALPQLRSPLGRTLAVHSPASPVGGTSPRRLHSFLPCGVRRELLFAAAGGVAAVSSAEEGALHACSSSHAAGPPPLGACLDAAHAPASGALDSATRPVSCATSSLLVAGVGGVDSGENVDARCNPTASACSEALDPAPSAASFLAPSLFDTSARRAVANALPVPTALLFGSVPAPAARSATSVVEARRSRRGSIDGCARTSTASAHVMSTPIAQTVGAKRRQPGMRALSSIHEQVYEPGMPLGDAQPPASKRCARSPMPHALDEDV